MLPLDVQLPDPHYKRDREEPAVFAHGVFIFLLYFEPKIEFRRSKSAIQVLLSGFAARNK